MELIKKDKQKRVINSQEEIQFSSFSSWHLIITRARAKSEKQLSQQATDDEDLTVSIDNKTFPELGSNRLVDSPAAINGGKLHDLTKAVYFITYLQGKDHQLILNADNPPGTATLEGLEIYTLDPKVQAEDGDRREWITFVLDDISLVDIGVTTTYSRRKRDSDDVKIRIDGQTQENLLRNIKHFLWYFAGSFLPEYLLPEQILKSLPLISPKDSIILNLMLTVCLF